MIVIGGLSCAAFVVWEICGAPHPLLPFARVRNAAPSSALEPNTRATSNRTIIACMLIALFHPASGAIIGGYLYTFCAVPTHSSLQRITDFLR